LKYRSYLAKGLRPGEIKEETATNLADISVIEVGPTPALISIATSNSDQIVQVRDADHVESTDPLIKSFYDLNRLRSCA